MKIDSATREIVLKYIRKYDEYLDWYVNERERIISGKGIKYDELGLPHALRLHDSTASAVTLLERLDDSHKAKVINAIQTARGYLGAEIIDERSRKAFQEAIWLSCLNRKDYPFEVFEYDIGYGRSQFYEKKAEFISEIAYYLGL